MSNEVQLIGTADDIIDLSKNNYDYFNENIKLFVLANAERLSLIKEEACIHSPFTVLLLQIYRKK